MKHSRTFRFSGPLARFQYALLMGLFRIVWSRGGYGALARGLGRIFGQKTATFLVNDGAAPFKIYLNDGYWTRFGLFYPDYEPEVAAVINAAAGKTPLFCDLGANKGYWVTQAKTHFDKIIAVEASEQTFRALAENAEELDNVSIHKLAIHETSGQTLTFVNTHLSHASARLLGSEVVGQNDGIETVETVCIDDLVPRNTAALIKLDVEGAEIAAIDGARQTLVEGSVLIYEDHGSDDDCAPSAHLLNTPSIHVFSIENGVQRVNSIDEIRAIKTDIYKGYNFLAAHEDSKLLTSIFKSLQSTALTDTDNS